MRIKQIDVNVWIDDGYGDVTDEPGWLSYEIDEGDTLENYFEIEGPVTLEKLEQTCEELAENEFDDVSYVTLYIVLDTGDVYFIGDTCDLDENNSNTLEDTYSIEEFEKLFINN